MLERAAADGDDDAVLEKAQLSALPDDDADPRQVCTWKGEYGAPNVLLVRPAVCPQWHRSGDVIDDVEEFALRGDDGSPRIVTLKDGIYPFEGLYMDSRTGEPCKLTHANMWKRASLSNPDTEGRAEALTLIARAMGFTDHADAERHVVPLVPAEIRRVCSWGQLFTDPDVWRQLRPLLYVYWG